METVTFLGNAVRETKNLFDFPRADKQMIIRYRPQACWGDMEKMQPSIKNKYYSGNMSSKNVSARCNDIPYKIIGPWGPRNTFIRLLWDTIKALERTRDFHVSQCIRGGNPLTLQKTLQRHKIANAAITYLRTVAYKYWVCI